MSSKLDAMAAALILEDRSALNYAVNVAWPTGVDADDQEAEQLCRDAWRSEEPFLGRLVGLISDHEAPLMDRSFRFSPARLNFARWSHIIEVLPAMIEEECEVLTGIISRLDEAAVKELLGTLMRVKHNTADRMIELHQKQAAARAARASGAGEVADASDGGGDDGMAFRDANMAIDDRMAKVKGADKATKLWAAMAQTDCTACGYDCEGYARAIAAGEEKDLGKCVPGEDDTANMLKKIMGA